MAVLKSAHLLSLLYVLASAPTATLSKPLLLESVLGPIVDTIGTIASGAGLIEGTLGAVKGVLGVDQT